MTEGVAGELVDVVDDDDRVIATVTRAAMRSGRLRHRAVYIAVFASDGRLLVHRRAATKDLWPDRWDVAAGGVVTAGEPIDAAARRELAEELGISTDVVAVGGGRYADADVSVIGTVYRCVHDGPFSFADGEVTEVRWVDRNGLAALLTTETFVPDSVALALPLLADDFG